MSLAKLSAKTLWANHASGSLAVIVLPDQVCLRPRFFVDLARRLTDDLNGDPNHALTGGLASAGSGAEASTMLSSTKHSRISSCTKRPQNRPSEKQASGLHSLLEESGSPPRRGPSPSDTASDPSAALEGEVDGEVEGQTLCKSIRPRVLPLPKAIRLDWLVDTSMMDGRIMSQVRFWQTRRHVACINRQLQRQAIDAQVELTSVLSRPQAHTDHLAVGLCHQAVRLPPWAMPVRTRIVSTRENPISIHASRS